MCVCLRASPPPQCGVHVDQPADGGGGAGGLGAGGPGPGGPGHQRGAGGALPHRGRGGGGGPRRHPHQLPGREAAHAPARRLPGRPAGPHLRGLQCERRTAPRCVSACHSGRPTLRGGVGVQRLVGHG